MVDLRPLLFLNALALMLLVTAGFAVHNQEFTLQANNLPANNLKITRNPVSNTNSTDSTIKSAATKNTVAKEGASRIQNTPSESLLSSNTVKTTRQNLNEELEQFRASEDIPDATVDDAILFVDQLSPEEQSTFAAKASGSVKKKEQPSTLLASADARQAKTLAQQIVEKSVSSVKPPLDSTPGKATSHNTNKAKPVKKPVILPETGKLIVRSNVTGDKVIINGKSHGSTALRKDFPPGDYAIVVSKPGYNNWSSTINLGKGDERTIIARLNKITAVKYLNGVWKHGIVTGQGTYEGSDGTTYRGDFLNKMFHGRGSLIMADKTEYNGEWLEGRKHGRGTLSKSNGDSYTGEFRNDEFNGEGTLTLASGDIYNGYWVDGRLSGEGTFTGKDGTLYVGGFSENQFHGNGSLSFPDGTHYEGGLANGKYQGKGELVYADGKKYTGQFFEGRFHGQGELQNPNGSKISGTFKFGEPFGLATLTTPEGEIFTARSSEPGVCYRLKSYRAIQCPPMEGW